jgi:hypothetical protein
MSGKAAFVRGAAAVFVRFALDGVDFFAIWGAA